MNALFFFVYLGACWFISSPLLLAVDSASAELKPTQGNQVTGKVTFTKVEGGVRVVADVDHLSAGKHGFHIHEEGDCSSLDGSSAGGHFNPLQKKHGAPKEIDRHVGDLGNIEADSQGRAHYELIDPILSLEGPDSILGRSVIVHELEDDFTTQPTGNAGKRVACGVIRGQ